MEVAEIKHFCHRKLKDAIDPNMIVIDPSPLLDTEIDNLHQDFKKLLNRLKDKLTEGTDDEDGDEDLEGTEYKHIHQHPRSWKVACLLLFLLGFRSRAKQKEWS